jgi:hypothetical protein
VILYIIQEIILNIVDLIGHQNSTTVIHINPIYCFTTPGIHSIILHINDGGCQSSDTMKVNIHTSTKRQIIGLDSICIWF